jgi:hypothetical protein
MKSTPEATAILLRADERVKLEVLARMKWAYKVLWLSLFLGLGGAVVFILCSLGIKFLGFYSKTYAIIAGYALLAAIAGVSVFIIAMFMILFSGKDSHD